MWRVVRSAAPVRVGWAKVGQLGSHQRTVAKRFGASLSAASAPVSIGTTPPPSPDEHVEFFSRVWHSKWFGTVEGGSALDAAVASDANWFSNLLVSLQSALGVEAWVLLLLAGVSTRLVTLVFSLYGERATARMQLALPELQAPQDAFNKVYYNANASAMNVQIAAAALKSERRRVFGKYQTSNVRCLAPLFGSPLILTGLYQVSALCTNPLLDVGTSSFFWCTALTLPDPFFILPTTFCVLTLANFELSITKEMKRGWMSNIIWGARVGCLCVMPVAATFRSGVSLYFIGMSLAGLLQPLLVRSPTFRRVCGFPTLEQVRDVTDKGPADVIQSRTAVQFPYLSHLLNPETDENAQELFKRADTAAGTSAMSRRARPSRLPSPPTPQPSPSASRLRAAHTMADPESLANHGRYAPGSNPLMREVPVRQQQTAPPARGDGRRGSHGSVTPQGSAGAAMGAPPTERCKSKPGKGTAFASSGWKASNVTFDESDFSPFTGAGGAGKK